MPHVSTTKQSQDGVKIQNLGAYCIIDSLEEKYKYFISSLWSKMGIIQRVISVGKGWFFYIRQDLSRHQFILFTSLRCLHNA